MSGKSANAIQRSQVDLLHFIDWSGVECLNQNTAHSLPNALKQGYREDDGLNLESDADEQLLIYIPFTQVVKLHSFVIKGPEEEGKPVVLKFVKFQNVRGLTIFIEDNQGGSDVTKVQKIALFGTTVRAKVYIRKKCKKGLYRRTRGNFTEETSSRQQEKEETAEYQLHRKNTALEQKIVGTINIPEAEMASRDWSSNYGDKERDIKEDKRVREAELISGKP